MKKNNIIESLTVLIEHKKLIIILMIMISILSVIYALITPKYWKSTTTFTVESNSGSNLSMANGLSNMGIGSMLKSLNSSSEGQRFINVMTSRSFREGAIKEFKIEDYLKITEKDTLAAMDMALRGMNKIISVSLSIDSGIISISAETKDRLLSRDLCNYYREQSERIIMTQTQDEKKSEYDFLKERIEEYNDSYERKLEEIKEFQEKNKLVSLESSQEVLLQSYSDLVAESMESDIDFELIENQISPESFQYKMYEARSNKLNQKIKEFESNHGLSNGSYLIGLKNIPAITQEFGRLYFELELYGKISLRLYPLFEMAKLNYLRVNKLTQILDDARVAGLRSRPSRARLVITIFLLSFVIICGIILVFGLLSNEEKHKLKLLWFSFLGRGIC